MPRETSLAEVLALHADAVKADIRKIGVGIVVGVSNMLKTGTIDVRPAVSTPAFDLDGNRSDTFEAVLPDIPLGCLRTGAHMVWLPVAVGDHVEIYGSDLSLDTWRNQTGAATPVNPGMASRHTADSMFAVPQFTPDAAFPGDPLAAGSSNMIVGAVGGVQMRISSALAAVAHIFTAAQYVALSNLVDSVISTIVADFNSHTHAITAQPVSNATPAAPGPVFVTGVTATPATPIPPQPSTACTKLKAE